MQDCRVDPTLQDQTKPSGARWRFFRDVVVFELKMFIGNLRDFRAHARIARGCDH